MKVSLLSGAVHNAGDHLIVKRCEQLIRNRFPKANISVYNRNEPLDEFVSEINCSDVIIMGGGPLLQKDIFPKRIPLVKELNEISVPFFAMAIGQGLETDYFECVNNMDFSDETFKFILRMKNDGFSIGCRDFITTHLVKKIGIENYIMTGCAAWYDLRYIDKYSLDNKNSFYQKICISDPNNPLFYNQFFEVINYIQSKYNSSQLYVIFQHGIDIFISRSRYGQEIFNKIKELDVHIVEINDDYEGFKIYDDCSLHVGYRVHSHIYNLSQRRKSILIEEDGRGAGVNQALGLKSIKAYKYPGNYKSKLYYEVINKCRMENRVSDTVLDEIDSYLTDMEQNDFLDYEICFKKMRYYYDKMMQHIEQLSVFE